MSHNSQILADSLTQILMLLSSICKPGFEPLEGLRRTETDFCINTQSSTAVYKVTLLLDCPAEI